MQISGPTPQLDHASPHWFRYLCQRVRILWPLKAVGTMGFMALFFWAYFAVLRHPLGQPFEMPRIFLDDAIPLTPAAFPVYASLWVYVSLPPAFLGGFRALLGFTLGMGALCLFCLGLFWLFPTTISTTSVDWRLYPELALIKSVDGGGNACPSLHVASSVFAAVWLERIARGVAAPTWMRIASATFCIAILWSTVATRQHVVLDVLAGMLAGFLFAWPALRHTERHATGQI
jgi:hypothetical protein